MFVKIEFNGKIPIHGNHKFFFQKILGFGGVWGDWWGNCFLTVT